MGKGMIDFLGTIQEPIIIFADEYEKVFKGTREDEYNVAEADSTLLTLMDGVMKTTHKKLFLLTTNEPKIHAAMQQRPGRILFTKTFGNLSRKVIEEIVDDKLLYVEMREKTISFLSKLEMITVDIVTSMVMVVNILKRDLEELKEILNVKELGSRYDVILLKEDSTEETLAYSQELNYGDDPSKWEEYQDFRTKGVSFGGIREKIDELTFKVSMPKAIQTKYKLDNASTPTVSELKRMLKAKEIDQETHDDLYHTLIHGGNHKEFTLRLDPVVSYHASYAHLNAF